LDGEPRKETTLKPATSTTRKNRKQYRVIATRVFNLWEKEALATYTSDYRSLRRSVRLFVRDVRAGGAYTRVYVAIVREAIQ
jgi:hypothetical protein